MVPGGHQVPGPVVHVGQDLLHITAHGHVAVGDGQALVAKVMLRAVILPGPDAGRRDASQGHEGKSVKTAKTEKPQTPGGPGRHPQAATSRILYPSAGAGRTRPGRPVCARARPQAGLGQSGFSHSYQHRFSASTRPGSSSRGRVPFELLAPHDLPAPAGGADRAVDHDHLAFHELAPDGPGLGAAFRDRDDFRGVLEALGPAHGPGYGVAEAVPGFAGPVGVHLVQLHQLGGVGLQLGLTGPGHIERVAGQFDLGAAQIPGAAGQDFFQGGAFSGQRAEHPGSPPGGR